MSENMKLIVPLAMFAFPLQLDRNGWQDLLESHVPEMTLEDFDCVWQVYVNLLRDSRFHVGRVQ
jgi:hypothetical protein